MHFKKSSKCKITVHKAYEGGGKAPIILQYNFSISLLVVFFLPKVTKVNSFKKVNYTIMQAQCKNYRGVDRNRQK